MENNKKDLEKFSLIMWGVAEEFGGKISKEGMKMKFEAMKDFSIEEIQQAGTYLLKHRKKDFPAVPTVREFVEAIETQYDSKVSTGSLAIVQADLVIKHVKWFSPDGMLIVFKDPITAHLMKNRWSLKTLSETLEEKENVWFRKEFVRAYEAYSEIVDKGEIANLIENKELLKLADSSTKKIGS